MDFFEKFKQAEYEFTYGALDDAENYNALQVGLVAYFYIDKGYLKDKREAIAKAFKIYHQEFGEKLTWSFFEDPNHPDFYSNKVHEKYIKIIENADGEHVDFWCTSTAGTEHASDYNVTMLSSADWFELIHRPVSFLSIYLPIDELNNRSKINSLVINLCTILNPLHGLMGLGIQQCLERETFQHLEYDICQGFLAIDITNSNTDDHLRNGIRSINWYTFCNDHWLGKLGGINSLRSKLNDPRIQITSYDGGVIVRAGEWPELGWVKDNPYPELYVKVNNALKPIRAPEIGSLGYGSIAGEIRFDRNSTAQWLKRFDVDLPGTNRSSVPTEPEPERITAFSGEISPHTGRWGTFIDGSLRYVHLKQGQKLPDYEDKEGKLHRTLWSLLERDDKGSVFINS